MRSASYITSVKPYNRCNIWPIFRRRGRLFCSGVGLECFVFDPRGEGSYTSLFDNILRVVWICFDVDQFCAIVHDSDCTRSSMLALFSVHCHVERDNDDLDEALEVLDGVKVESDDVGDMGGACQVATWRFNFSHCFQILRSSPFYLPKLHHHHDIYNNTLATSPTVITFAVSRVCNLTKGVNKILFLFIRML